MTLTLELLYGSLSLFISILNNVFLLYHVDIFVSVYKIDKTSFWIGETIFLLWNSINDPFFGWLSDKSHLLKSFSQSRTNHKYNSDIIKRRIRALQLNGPFFAISFMTFWLLWLKPSLQFVICLCLYDTFLSMIDLHHSALMADIAISAEGRTKLNSWCSIFSALGSASVFLSYFVWDKENLLTFRAFCVALAILSAIGFLTASRLMEKAYINQEKTNNVIYDNSISLNDSTELQTVLVTDISAMKAFLTQLVSHKNFLYFSAMNLIQVFHCHFNSNFFPLFLENLIGGSVSSTFASFLLGLSFVAPHINNLYFLSLCRTHGVYAIINLLFIIKLMLGLVMLVLGPSHVWILCLFIASNRIFTEGTCKLLNLVISDLVDEDYVQNDRSQPVSALYFGTAALLSKPGQTLAPLIGTWLLTLRTGHDVFSSGRDAMYKGSHLTDPSLRASHRQGCFDILVYVPIICALAQLLIWQGYNLRGGRLARVKAARLYELDVNV